MKVQILWHTVPSNPESKEIEQETKEQGLEIMVVSGETILVETIIIGQHSVEKDTNSEANEK